MKKFIQMATGVVLFTGLSGGVMAACAPPYLNGPAATTLLNGNTACSPANCNAAGCTWQEQHRTNGELWDYKKGSDPVDPTSKEGTWSIASTGKVTHSYSGGGGSYTYDVKSNGSGSYSFCGGPAEIFFSVKTGVAAGCP